MATKIEDDSNIPLPDPTVLTTAALDKAIAGLRDLLTAERIGQREIFMTRLDEMDKAEDLIHKAIDKIAEDVDRNVVNLRTLHEEKFRSIQTQFAERDVRTEQSAKDSKVAVDAALQAAKEAVGEQNKSSSLAIAKSETATTKQIDQLGVLITSTTKTTDDKIDDIKQRLTTIEGRANGVSTTKDDSRSNIALLISMVVAAVILLQGVVSFFHVISPPPSVATSAPQLIYVPAQSPPATMPAPAK